MRVNERDNGYSLENIVNVVDNRLKIHSQSYFLTPTLTVMSYTVKFTNHININICQKHWSIYMSITSYDIDPNRHICDSKFCSGFEARKLRFVITDPVLAR
jgi:hypothetical protein